MMDEQIARMEQRLTQVEGALERARLQVTQVEGALARTRRQRRTGWLVGICGVTTALIAATAAVGTTAAAHGLQAPQPLTVRAPFKVVGSSGQPLMGVDANGLLTVYRRRLPAVVLGPGADAFGLVQVNNPSGNPVVGLSSLADGTGRLAVVGDEGRMTSLDTPSNSSEMALRFLKGGAVQARVGADKNGGTLHLNAEHGPSVDLGTTQSGQTRLQFLQGDKILGGVGADSTGGLLQLNNATGKKMLLLGTTSHSGTVEVYDTAGENKILLSTTAAGLAELNLYSSPGVPAVQLAEGRAGGYVALTNLSGVARVVEGVLPGSDKGLVKAYGPRGFNYIEGRG